MSRGYDDGYETRGMGDDLSGLEKPAIVLVVTEVDDAGHRVRRNIDLQAEYGEGLDSIDLADRRWYFGSKLGGAVGGKLWRLNEPPYTPADVQEMAFLLLALKHLRPVAATDPDGTGNAELNPRAKWLVLIRRFDTEMADRARSYIERQGEMDYLGCCLAPQ